MKKALIIALVLLCITTATRSVYALPRTAVATAAATPGVSPVYQRTQRNVNLAIGTVRGTISALGTNTVTANGKTINIALTTHLVRRFGAKSFLTEFSVGDEVVALGRWSDQTQTVLTARVIRNLSIQKRHGHFVGSIASLTTSTIILDTVHRGSLTVTLSPTAKLVDRTGKTITAAQLAAGQKISVWGTFDNKLMTVNPVTKVRDLSLPPRTNATIPPAGAAR